MSSHLDEILSVTRRGVEERKSRSDRAQMERAAGRHTPRGFARAVRASDGPAVIAELKRASPSRGMIRPGFDPSFLAESFARGGAAALSVLTEEHFFLGSLQTLEAASEASGLPCLRKDFMVDEFQVLEARAHRADAVLLIAVALEDPELRRLAAAAHDYQLDVLCEVHTSDELERVLDLDLGCEAIGVNNRDLRSFAVRLEVSLELAARLPAGAVHVAESGIHTADDMHRLRDAGFEAFLIGESLMRQPDPGSALRELLDAFALEAGAAAAPVRSTPERS